MVAFYQDGEEMQTRAYVAGSGEPERRLKRLYANRDTARVAAERELRRVKRLTTLQLTVPGRFVTAGSPLVLAGSPTRLERAVSGAAGQAFFWQGLCDGD